MIPEEGLDAAWRIYLALPGIDLSETGRLTNKCTRYWIRNVLTWLTGEGIARPDPLTDDTWTLTERFGSTPERSPLSALTRLSRSLAARTPDRQTRRPIRQERPAVTYKLAALRFRSVGERSARFQDLTLTFTAPADDASEPQDPVIWLRNGGGKSSILSLLYALLLPRATDFMGRSVQRSLTDYIDAGDTAHVVAIWEPTDASGTWWARQRGCSYGGGPRTG